MPPSAPARPVDGRPWGEAIHASAVAIAGFGLLIFGPSGSGKSRLALALIAASTRARRIRLVGDDRILLAHDAAGALIARPHPRIGGFIERRGSGILACPFVAAAPVRGLVVLGRATPDGRSRCPTTLPPEVGQNFPCLPVVINQAGCSPDTLGDAVLGWWRDACTTPVAKADARWPGAAKD